MKLKRLKSQFTKLRGCNSNYCRKRNIFYPPKSCYCFVQYNANTDTDTDTMMK